MEFNLLFLGHSAESKRSPFPNIARVEVADGAGDPQALRVTVCVKKQLRTADSGWSSILGFWAEVHRFPSTCFGDTYSIHL